MSTPAVTPNTEAAILARLLHAGQPALTPEVARYLLSLCLPAEDEERVNELSAQARAGSLTASEEQELDSYLHLGALLGILQSKARQRLKDVSQFAVSQ